jgi:hypothetical protein
VIVVSTPLGLSSQPIDEKNVTHFVPVFSYMPLKLQLNIDDVTLNKNGVTIGSDLFSSEVLICNKIFSQPIDEKKCLVPVFSYMPQKLQLNMDDVTLNKNEVTTGSDLFSSEVLICNKIFSQPNDEEKCFVPVFSYMPQKLQLNMDDVTLNKNEVTTGSDLFSSEVLTCNKIFSQPIDEKKCFVPVFSYMPQKLQLNIDDVTLNKNGVTTGSDLFSSEVLTCNKIFCFFLIYDILVVCGTN